jgi:hypothetical protein
MIKDNSQFFPVLMMCKVLDVSPSAYYDWLKRPLSLREQNNQSLSAQIQEIFDTEKQRVGSMRITRILRKSGQMVGKNRVADIMRKKIQSNDQ